ncbi:ATP-dependent DNA helicase RecG [uncultured Fibrobacter sp.]|uniref:ATP-dependent DNA helicase RecG n=1 Tax=uncultured Fibrobacter sp. TaxID=261512 RepID=UPI0028065953|nr:ATP-dependent DNA helicase RecG [uncultured Fibrobacter sp.]
MDLSSIPGLGPKRLKALSESGLHSVSDLLFNIPRTWLDRTRLNKIAESKVGENVIFTGVIRRSGIVPGRMSRVLAVLDDGTGQVNLVFFRGARHWAKTITVGSRWCVIGKLGDYRGLQLVHPEMQRMEEGEEFAGGIEPVYTITEAEHAAKIEQNFFRNLYPKIFALPNLSVPNAPPSELTDYMGIAPVIENLKRLHTPKTFVEAMQAKQQLKKIELLPFCLRMNVRRRNLVFRGKARDIDQELLQKAQASLPFALTRGQKDAVQKILDGLQGKKQFHALLQGDVGSGKTVVAMLAMLAVAQCGEQCALMVPTDILARQHYKNLKPFFDAAGIRSALLLGACSAAEKKTISGELQMGLTQIVIGTHALFSKDVLFKDLTFVVIDEQHRFGVNQREALLKKGTYPDLLVMSATPIPRSLAMTIYGDLEPIILNEKPAGRKPVKTRLVAPAKRDDMKKFILNEVQNGNRCYWVVSRVEIDDEGGSRSVGEVQEELESFNSHWKVGAVHGQMDETERDAILNAFAKGDIQVLVATTVIEVGVNVPEANLMVIDAPERFGLAQLHQLRGRVGRGDQEAWCFLIVPQQSPAHERLTHFASTDDGFKIAEMDMQERGAGNLEGSEQSGAWVFRWFDWIADQGLIQKMLILAEEILDNKPGFSKETQEKIQNWYAALPQGNSDGVH